MWDMKFVQRLASRTILVQIFAAGFFLGLGFYALARILLQRVDKSSKLNFHCTWLPQFFFDRHGPHPQPRPAFSITKAWLKPETARYGKAPKTIPNTLRDEFTLGNSVKVKTLYFDQAFLGGKALMSNWTTELIDSYRRNITQRQPAFNYPVSPVYEALDAYANLTVASQRGIVIGSAIPWLEAFLLEYGAAKVTTVEFGTIISTHPQIVTFTPQNFTMSFLQGDIESFDFAFSYSSIEHDGLGRFGDVLNPLGDLETMAKMLSVVKPGGFMFLGVPCCQDALLWNGCWIYGKKRLAKLFAGWRIVAVFPSDAMERDTKLFEYEFQPVWLLQNTFGCADGEHTDQIAGLFRSFRVR